MSSKFRFLFSLSFAFVMCVCLTTFSAYAQRPRFKPNGGGIFGIALRADVQKEIGIDNDMEKTAKISQLSDVIVEELKELRAATKGDADKYSHSAAENIRMKHNDELKEILTAQQYQRLQQIHWQMVGYPALTEPDLIDGLKLTSNQIEKILVANREFVEQYGEYMAKVQKAQQSRPEMQERRTVVDGFVEARKKKSKRFFPQLNWRNSLSCRESRLSELARSQLAAVSRLLFRNRAARGSSGTGCYAVIGQPVVRGVFLTSQCTSPA